MTRHIFLTSLAICTCLPAHAHVADQAHVHGSEFGSWAFVLAASVAALAVFWVRRK